MKVKEMTVELEKVSKILETELQAAYAAFTHGWKHKWTYSSWTIADFGEFVGPLENCKSYFFIPAITDGHVCSDEERLILSPPPRFGGLGILNSVTNADQECNHSPKVTSAVAEKIIIHDQWNDVDGQKIKDIKSKISKESFITQEICLKNFFLICQIR